MNSKLSRITDWAARAARAGYRISTLAKSCGTSERHLRRFIDSEFGQPPHTWIMGLRLRRAPKLLAEGLLIKEVSGILHFQTPEHFSIAFKKQYGVSPRAFRLRLLEKRKKPRHRD